MVSKNKSPFSIIRAPIITEKAAVLRSTPGGAIFKVHPNANKVEIKRAVESIFEVKVRKVRTVNTLGKVRRVGLSVGRQKSFKKAYVYFEPGSSIDMIEGL
jgi:large subunit ribosomal protein L23